MRESRFNNKIEHFFNTTLPKEMNLNLRENQIILADNIYNCINNEEILIQEAQVGIGKTFAYIIPAIICKYIKRNSSIYYNNPIVISTGTKNLQDQLEKDAAKFWVLLGDMIIFNIICLSWYSCRKGPCSRKNLFLFVLIA